jgi:hypothetical protein
VKSTRSKSTTSLPAISRKNFTAASTGGCTIATRSQRAAIDRHWDAGLRIVTANLIALFSICDFSHACFSFLHGIVLSEFLLIAFLRKLSTGSLYKARLQFES